ncbi:indole-3-glycerol phosphate synthase TrpC [bacterium]|nr:MAG: indole-3-glycerol phosphate synthase TrpC [bacterium]
MSAVPILERILQATARRVEEAKRAVPEAVLRARLPARPPADLAAALTGGDIRVIAEVKRASPSQGDLAPGLDAGACAYEYQDHGAAAVSVLTEPEFFKGSLADLDAARAAVGIPVLRKDFVLDEYQLLEARAHGADAVLLIVAALDDSRLRALYEKAVAWGLSALVEVHDEDELRRALAVGARLVGVNNRNLKTLAVDPGTTARLAPLAKAAGAVVVGESGVSEPAGLAEMARAGCSAALVGTALTKTGRPGAALARLLGRPVGTRVKVCGLTRAEDAYTATRLGAWALGFVFVPGTPRVVTVEAARRAMQGAGAGVFNVGVFADQPEAEVRRTAEEAGLDLIQLHGAETDLLSGVLGDGRVVKAVTLGAEADIPSAAARSARWLLVDRSKGVPGEPTVDWGLAGRLAARRPRTLLAGGLTPQNVEAAVSRAKPWGVDVSSGVERSPGVKEGPALEAFFAAVRRADAAAGLL